jgi:hypothetical protein
MNKIIYVLCFSTLFFVNIAIESYAQTVYFKEPMEFAGTGCGTGSYIVSGQDTAILVIAFSAYDAAEPADDAVSGLKHTSCSFSVPIHVPAGYQISELKAHWRGFSAGPTEFSREYFFSGKTGISKTSNPSGNFIEQDQNMNFSSCSKDGEKNIILRINSSVQAMGSENYNYISIDSVARILFLLFSTCSCNINI